MKKRFDFSGAAEQWRYERYSYVVQWMKQNIPVAKRAQERAQLSPAVVDNAVNVVCILHVHVNRSDSMLCELHVRFETFRFGHWCESLKKTGLTPGERLP